MAPSLHPWPAPEPPRQPPAADNRPRAPETRRPLPTALLQARGAAGPMRMPVRQFCDLCSRVRTLAGIIMSVAVLAAADLPAAALPASASDFRSNDQRVLFFGRCGRSARFATRATRPLAAEPVRS